MVERNVSEEEFLINEPVRDKKGTDIFLYEYHFFYTPSDGYGGFSYMKICN